MKQWLAAYEAELSKEHPHNELIYFPKVVEYLRKEGLFTSYVENNEPPDDITKKVYNFLPLEVNDYKR